MRRSPPGTGTTGASAATTRGVTALARCRGRRTAPRAAPPSRAGDRAASRDAPDGVHHFLRPHPALAPPNLHISLLAPTRSVAVLREPVVRSRRRATVSEDAEGVRTNHVTARLVHPLDIPSLEVRPELDAN